MQPYFNPKCLPSNLTNYTFLSGLGKGKAPFVYNTWIFTEVCGPRMTAWRAIYQLPRRGVMFKVAEAVLINWGIYAAGTLIGSILMNFFYIAPKRKRCCGLFPEVDYAWETEIEGGCTYQQVTGCMYAFIVFPIAVLVIAACIYQFVRQLMSFHGKIADLMSPTCYPFKPGNLQTPKPPAVCHDIMRLDWPCNQDMVKILVMVVFCIIDCLFIVAVTCYMCFLTFLSFFRIACCCCGCLTWKACFNRPECMCGPNFSCGMCLCWTFCHPTAFWCVNCCAVIVLGLYFGVGLALALLAFGCLFLIPGLILFGCEQCTRYCCEVVSSGRCRRLRIPWQWYARTLIPWPQHYAGHASKGGARQQQKLKDDIFSSMNADGASGGERPFDPDMGAGEPGFEEDVMGTPFPAFTMLAFPYPIMITVVPIGLLVIVACTCFIWEDYLARVKAWSENGMKWYMDDGRMGPGWKAWLWWFQVFVEMLGGLTDAWIAIFQAWWGFIYNTFTFNKSYYKHVTNFFAHGVNPINLFQVESFPKFRMGVIFWRFILTTAFTCIRTTALINLPASAIPGNARDPYDDIAGVEEADPFDPMRGY